MLGLISPGDAAVIGVILTTFCAPFIAAYAAERSRQTAEAVRRDNAQQHEAVGQVLAQLVESHGRLTGQVGEVRADVRTIKSHLGLHRVR